MAAFMAAMTFYLSGSTVNHFYDAYDTSNNHTIRALDELVGGGGDTTSQAKSNSAMNSGGAISAIFLVFMTGLIRFVYAKGLR